MYLHENALTGSIPESLGSATFLEEIYFYGNRLSGSIPSSLGQLSHLKELRLYNIRLIGPIPSEFSSLSKLDYLLLESNSLTGPLPDSLSKLTQLRSFDARFNKITGSIPESYSKFKPFTLQLNSNELTGCLPVGIAADKILSGNKIVGVCTKSASQPSSTSFTPKAPPSIGPNITSSADNIIKTSKTLSDQTIKTNPDVISIAKPSGGDVVHAANQIVSTTQSELQMTGRVLSDASYLDPPSTMNLFLSFALALALY